MPRYDWSNRDRIESRRATYKVFIKSSGAPVYEGIAEDAYDRLVKGRHPQFVEGTYVVVDYYHGNTSVDTLLTIETGRIEGARLARKNIQKNPYSERVCVYPLCENIVIYPSKYCKVHM